MLSGMKANKPPGPDGLPAEFYKIFFNEIIDDLLEVFMEIVNGRHMSKFMNQAVTVLIPKSGDKTDPSSERLLRCSTVIIKC